MLAPVSSIMGEILFFAISSEADDPTDPPHDCRYHGRDDACWRCRVSLRVTPIGGAERQFQVIAHPDALRANNISLTELLSAARGEPEHVGWRITPKGAGIRGGGRRPSAHAGRDRRDGRGVAWRPVRAVRDVADVREGAAFKRGEGSHSGKPAVIVGVLKQPGANTIEVTERLDRALDTLQSELPTGMTIDRRIFRQADFIEVAIDNVIRALRDGALLVVVVVLLFLANLRASAITLTAMPLSLAAAVLVLRALARASTR